MAKKSAINTNEHRRKLVDKFAKKRAALKALIRDPELSREDRFRATLKLAELPRNSSKTRVRNRCDLTGRPRGFYRKLKLSRIAIREMGAEGKIPGLVKSSW